MTKLVRQGHSGTSISHLGSMVHAPGNRDRHACGTVFGAAFGAKLCVVDDFEGESLFSKLRWNPARFEAANDVYATLYSIFVRTSSSSLETAAHRSVTGGWREAILGCASLRPGSNGAH